MSGTVNIEGPSAGTGAPKVVPETINSAVNAALAQKAGAADVLAVTEAAEAGLAQKADLATAQATTTALVSAQNISVANQQLLATQTVTIDTLTAAIAVLQGRLTGVEGRATVLETATPPPAVPNIVATFTLGAVTTTTQVLNWTAPAAGAAVTFYDTQVAPVVGGIRGTFVAGPTVAVGTLTATVTGLTQGTVYDFRVTTRNAAGPGPSSAVLRNTTTTTLAPSPAWTSIPPAAQIIGDDLSPTDVWTVVGGVVKLNGVNAGSSGSVFDLVKADTNRIFQGSNDPSLANNPGGIGYWYWGGTPPNWVWASNPRPQVPGNSTPRQQLITYLNSISGNHVLSGQMTHNTGAEYNANISQLGIAPALMTVDAYTDQWAGNYIYDPNFVNLLIAHKNAGGICGVSAIWPNPAGGGGAGDGNPVTASEVLRVGSPQYNTFMGFVDRVAQDALIPLKNAGIAIPFRHMMEMDGGWFWWGDINLGSWGKFTKAEQTALWKQVRTRLVVTWGLDNLLFEFAINGGPGSYEYPGDDVVDIFGVDTYTTSPAAVYGPIYDQMRLLAPSKPVVMAEWGAGLPNTPSFNAQILINDIKARMPRMCFFNAWPGWGLYQETNGTAALSDPYVINRGGVVLP